MTPPAPAADPDSAIAALRYLRALLDPGESTFMVPGRAETKVVGGELVVTVPADVSGFIRALGLAALSAMMEGARNNVACGDPEEAAAFVRRLIDVSIEAHTLDALAGTGGDGCNA